MKTVKYYHVDSYIGYPVGLCMAGNITAIQRMAFRIRDVFYNERINLWCRGSSGAIMAAIVASIIPNAIISYVRKPNETGHSLYSHATDKDRKNIVIDDLISSGTTIQLIKDFMLTHGVSVDCLCVGGPVYLEDLEEYSPVIICQSLYYRSNTMPDGHVITIS